MSGIESVWSGLESIWLHFVAGFQWWDVVGYAGTGVFASRFILQWYVSERLKQSVIPTAFWWISILGSSVLAIYFIGLGNGPGVIGNVPNSLVYIRNLQLIRKQRLASRALASTNTGFTTEPHAAKDPRPPA